MNVANLNSTLPLFCSALLLSHIFHQIQVLVGHSEQSSIQVGKRYTRCLALIRMGSKKIFQLIVFFSFALVLSKTVLIHFSLHRALPHPPRAQSKTNRVMKIRSEKSFSFLPFFCIQYNSYLQTISLLVHSISMSLPKSISFLLFHFSFLLFHFSFFFLSFFIFFLNIK